MKERSVWEDDGLNKERFADKNIIHVTTSKFKHLPSLPLFGIYPTSSLQSYCYLASTQLQ